MIVYIQCIGYRNLVYRSLYDRELNDRNLNDRDLNVRELNHEKIQLSDLLNYIRTELQIAKDVSIVVKHKTRILEPSSQIDNESRLVAQIIKKHNESPTNEFQRNEFQRNESPTNQFSTNNCKNNCGFYANGTSEYCSKCVLLIHPSNSIHPTEQFTNNTSTNNQFTTNQPNQPNQHQCNTCHKKIGLLGFLCKCGFKYCGLHRQPEQHECTFDYVSKKRDELRDQLVKCDNNKINKL